MQHDLLLPEARPGHLSRALGVFLAALEWAAGASVGTAVVSSFARGLCLPPYWPEGVAFNCRPEGVLPIWVVPESAVTALLLFFPALPLGVFVYAAAFLARAALSSAAARTLALLGAGVSWALLVERLEVSYLDGIVSLYAVGVGVIVGGVLGDRRFRRLLNRS